MGSQGWTAATQVRRELRVLLWVRLVCVGSDKIPHSWSSATLHPVIWLEGRRITGGRVISAQWTRTQGYLLAGPAAPTSVTFCSPSIPSWGQMEAAVVSQRHARTRETRTFHLQSRSREGGPQEGGLIPLPSSPAPHPHVKSRGHGSLVHPAALLLLPFCLPQSLPRFLPPWTRPSSKIMPQHKAPTLRVLLLTDPEPCCSDSGSSASRASTARQLIGNTESWAPVQISCIRICIF